LALLALTTPALAVDISAPDLMQGLRDYEFQFVGWCVLVAMVGGLGRTALTLLSPGIVVREVLRETVKDVLIAALAGCVASVALYAAKSMGINTPVPVDVLILAACGWARMSFFVWAGDVTKELSKRAKNKVADAIHKPAKPDPYTPWRGPSRVDSPDEDPDP
jgi:hypothetical protein